MEAAMERMARLLCGYCGQPAMLMETPGVGAAGGLPFGLLAGAQARLIPGFDLVAAWLNLRARIAAADIVVTGEGCFDESSLSGKGPGAVAAHAGALGKTVHVFAGRCTAAASGKGWHLHAITPAGHPLERANREAPELLARTLQAVF
jgi:glycerate kinase